METEKPIKHNVNLSDLDATERRGGRFLSPQISRSVSLIARETSALWNWSKRSEDMMREIDIKAGLWF